MTRYQQYDVFQEKKELFSICSKKIKIPVPPVVLLILRQIFFGTVLTQIFFIFKPLVKIWRTMVWVDPNCSPIILTVNQRSDRTGSSKRYFHHFLQSKAFATCFIFSRFCVEYALNCLQFGVLEKALSPYACLIFKSFRHSLLEIVVSHFKNVREKTGLRK